MQNVDQRYHLERRLQPQRQRIAMLPRNFLASQIDDGLKGQIVLVRAPTGFGKTEALAACYRRLIERGENPSWLTVARDTDGERLEVELAHALGRPERRLSEVLQELAEGSTDRTLFIDQAEQLITGSSVERVNRILREAPDNLRIVFAGRTLPQLALSRFRVRGLLAEVGYRNLALDRTETHSVLGRGLPMRSVDALHATLMGWPAMVALARLALDESVEPLRLEALVEGAHRMLRDYVLEEVLPDLTEGARAIVEGMAGFGVLSAALLAQFADRTPDHDFIREVEIVEPIVFRSEERYDGYRVHPVVERVILGVVDEHDQGRRLRERKAAQVFANYGMLDRAVVHAARGEDFDHALAIFEGAGGVTLFSRMGFAMLLKLVQSFPQEMMRDVPSLRLARALVLGKQGRVVEARKVLDALALDLSSRPELADRVGAFAIFCINSMIAHYRDRRISAAELAEIRDMMATSNPDDSETIGWFHTLLILYLIPRDELAEAEEHALRALALYQDSRNTFAQGNVLLHLSVIHLQSNRLEAAKSYAMRAEQLVQSHQWSEVNLLALLHVVAATIQYRQGHHADALARLEVDVPVLDEGEAWVDLLVMGHATLARARWAAGERELAREAIDSARLQARRRNLPRLDYSMDTLELELAAREGDLEGATAMAARLANATQNDITYRGEQVERQIALARLLLRSGRSDLAVRDLDFLASELRSAGPARYLIPVGLLLVEGHWNGSRADAALAALHEVATLSLAGGQVQSFLDEGQPLAQAVNAMLRRLGLGSMSRQSAEYLALTMGGRRRIQRDIRFMLTLREQQILSAIAAGQSNKGIARQLEISEPTVKYHLKNLFAKLGVSRRTLAVSVARTIGLLGTTDVGPARPQRPSGR